MPRHFPPRRAPAARRGESAARRGNPAAGRRDLSAHDDPGADPPDPTEQVPVVALPASEKRRNGKRRPRAGRADASEAPEPAAEAVVKPGQAVAIEPLNGPDDGMLYPLTAVAAIVGRDPGSVAVSADELDPSQDVLLLEVPSDPKLSRAHLLVFQRNGEWWVRDLSSTNGTHLAHSGRPIPDEGQPLPLGLALRAGDTRLRLVLAGPDPSS